MFMKYFDIIRSHPFRDQKRVERHMPELVRRCIEEVGVGPFNDFIRENYVGKENCEETLYEGFASMYDHGWFSNIDRKYGFPQRVLTDAMTMTDDFVNAVKTVVFKDGIRLDISKLIQ